MTATTTLASGLVARTRAIEARADLLGDLAPDGFAWLTGNTGFVTSGVAARIAATDADATLARLEADDEIDAPGTGAIAVGALPFCETSRGELVIPARVVGRASDGRSWVTEIGAPTKAPAPRHTSPRRFEIASSITRRRWREQVEALLGRITAGELDKAVLARDVLITADAPFEPRAVLDRLRRTQADCFVFASAGLVGATPELLVQRRGAHVLSRPMAGTVARGASGEADDAASRELAESIKEQLEHRLVVDAVVQGLRGRTVAIDAVGKPEVERLLDVSHLATRITGRVSGASSPSALALALALHPTPAVGGAPREAALAALRELEDFDRARYAGPVGWVDGNGNGEWAVALRCAELVGNRARLFAGAGIVAGSDPDAEWSETQVKLEPMLRAIVRP